MTTGCPGSRKCPKTSASLPETTVLTLFPLQKPLEQQIEKHGYDAITTDGIHLTRLGQKILADIVRNAFQL